MDVPKNLPHHSLVFFYSFISANIHSVHIKLNKMTEGGGHVLKGYTVNLETLLCQDYQIKHHETVHRLNNQNSDIFRVQNIRACAEMSNVCRPCACMFCALGSCASLAFSAGMITSVVFSNAFNPLAISLSRMLSS